MTAPRVDAGAQILAFAAMAPVLFSFALVMLWAGAAWWFLRWAAGQIEQQDSDRSVSTSGDGRVRATDALAGKHVGVPG